MPVDIFLKLDGVDGEARDKAHEGEIDVLAWGWGMSNAGSIYRTGPSSGKFSIQDLRITKWVDRATPTLMLKCANNTNIKSAELVCRKAGGSPLEYLRIKMSDVLIAEITPGGSGGDDRFVEQIVLNFVKVHVTYQEQDEKGRPKGGTVEFTHDIAGKK